MATVKVEVTNDKDLILSFDFDKKIIEVESEKWIIVSKRKNMKVETKPTIQPQQEEGEQGGEMLNSTITKRTKQQEPQSKNIGEIKEDQKYNQQIKASSEVKLITFISLFESYGRLNQVQEIPINKVRSLYVNAGVFDAKEFNALLNKSIENGLIEEVADKNNFYRVIKK